MLTPYGKLDGSRYKLCIVNETTPRLELSPRPMLQLPDNPSRLGRYDVVQEGARIDVLAYTLLGDSRLWWALADLNRHIEDLYYIPAGTELFIPTVESVAGLV